MISSTLEIKDPQVTVENEKFRNKTWQAVITAWPDAAECYQHVYRYMGEITFEDSIVELPPITNETSWQSLYYSEYSLDESKSEKLIIYRSILSGNFYAEIQLPPGSICYGGAMDQIFLGENLEVLCNWPWIQINEPFTGTYVFRLPDPGICADGMHVGNSGLGLNIDNKFISDGITWDTNWAPICCIIDCYYKN